MSSAFNKCVSHCSFLLEMTLLSMDTYIYIYVCKDINTLTLVGNSGEVPIKIAYPALSCFG